jgi:uridine kinase
MDDFKNPWREATQLGYDRLSGEDYYRNAYDFISATQLLLGPAGPDGSGQVVLGAHDPLTGEDHRDVTVFAPPDAILIVDSLFAFRPQYNTYWEYRIWLDVDPHLSLTRGIERDMDAERRDEAVQVHRDRYKTAEAIYVAEVKAWAKADILIDNSDFANPRLLRPESIAHSP